MSARWRAILPFLLLYAASVAIRAWVNVERVSPGHGDVSDYYEVARNLADGRGFVVDYVWSYLHEPTGIPAPSNTWWMPLPSMICALAFKIAGSTEYVVAKWAMILLASLLPILTWLTARVLGLGRASAWAAAILAAGFHLFLDQTCAPLSYGPYTLFGGGALAVICAARERPRLLPLAGLLLGLSYLARGDSLVLLGPLAVVVLLSRREGAARIGFGTVALTLGIFALVCLPWWIRNALALGSPTPAGQSKMIWLKDYLQWYTARPETLTREAYLEQGWLKIYEQKQWAFGTVIGYTLECLYRSVAKPVALPASLADAARASPTALLWILGWVMTPLLWLGSGVLVRRGQWLPYLQMLGLVFFYGLLFSAISDQSYRTGLFILLPTFLCAIVAALETLLEPLRARAPRLRDGLLLALAAVLSLAGAAAAKPFLDNKGKQNEVVLAVYGPLKAWAERAGLTDAVFFTLNPWELTVETGLKSVKVPPDDAETILAIARKLGVSHVLGDRASWGSITDQSRGIATLLRNGILVPVPNDSGFDVFRFRPEVIDGARGVGGIDGK